MKSFDFSSSVIFTDNKIGYNNGIDLYTVYIYGQEYIEKKIQLIKIIIINFVVWKHKLAQSILMNNLWCISMRIYRAFAIHIYIQYTYMVLRFFSEKHRSICYFSYAVCASGFGGPYNTYYAYRGLCTVLMDKIALVAKNKKKQKPKHTRETDTMLVYIRAAIYTQNVIKVNRQLVLSPFFLKGL